MIQSYKRGGLKLIDLRTKEIVLKCTVVSKKIELDTQPWWLMLVGKLLPLKEIYFWNTNVHGKDVDKICKQGNIKSVSIIKDYWKAWANVHFNTEVGEEVMSQMILFNSNIRFRNMPITHSVIKIQKQIIIKDIDDCNRGTFHVFEEVQEKLGLKDFLMYMTIIKVIPKDWFESLQKTQVGQNDLNSKNDKVKPVRYYYTVILERKKQEDYTRII